MLTENSFIGALQKLKDTKTTAPVFYTLSGVDPNEGVVIEKKREGIHALFELTNDKWFVSVANTDKDKSTEKNDPRGYFCTKYISDLG